MEKKCRYCIKPVKIVLLVFIFWAIASLFAKAELPSATVAIAATKGERFTLVDWGWKQGEYKNNYIAGTIKNNTDKKYRYAQVSFSLYDESDAQVGSAMANINNLEPQGTWKFEAIVLNKNAVKARFQGITAF